jgi:hypothetical protein
MKILALLLVLSFSLLQAVIIEVYSDGTGDYPTIQNAIDFAQNYDTISVHPGIYYENLSITEKTLTVGSNFSVSNNPDDIANTIIDGNRSGSVISIANTDWLQINGFTIRNGSGEIPFLSYIGGGLNVDNSNIIVKNCHIQNNQADLGGGILLCDSNLNLEATTIRHNAAFNFGGGIYINNSDITYHPSNLNNIYLNYAGSGNDLFSTYNSPLQTVIVDTFTVANPTIYHTFPSNGYSIPIFPLESRFIFSIQNHVVDEVASDLFVSTSGDDDNSGETLDSPLKTIAYAMLKVESDSLTHRTVHVADGIYSESLNEQVFPIHLKDNVSILGESDSNTILDAESITGFFRSTYQDRNIGIRNFSLINGYNNQGIHLHHAIDFTIDNVDISNYVGSREVVYLKFGNGTVNNLRIHDGTFWGALSFGFEDDSVISNTRIYDNTEFSADNVFSYFSIGVHSSNGSVMNIINTEIVNNTETYSDWNTGGVALNITSLGYPIPVTCNLINSTIADNHADAFWGSAIAVACVSKLNIINSIVYGNTPYQIVLDSQTYPESLFVKNSIIQGGEDNIGSIGQGYIEWSDTNISSNPLWNVADGYYYLSSSSPAVDAGTTLMPEGVQLPEYDLTGQSRVYGEQIDIGCHEWNPTGIDEQNMETCSYPLSIYPNPFNPSTTICFELPEKMKATLSVFNIRGQKISTLIDEQKAKGIHRVVWNGADDKGKNVPSGVYFYRLETSNKSITGKMILMK